MSIWRVERLTRRGDGVAIGPDGRRALAQRILPGEEIDGEATDGGIVSPRIVTASPDRIKPVCGHYQACGGCSMMHATDAFTTGWKQQVVKNALDAVGIQVPVSVTHVSPPRSRRRAVLSGRRTKKGALIGFHGRASGTIVDLHDCHVMRPRIVAALPLLRRIIGEGVSRSAEISVTVIDGPAGLDVAIRGGKPMEPTLFHKLAELADTGDLARLDWDGEAITRRPPALPIGRAHVLPPPGSFLQATTGGEAAILAALREMTQDARRIADLFAGCGTFSLPLAETAQVHAVEGLAAPLAALGAGWRGAVGLGQVTTEIRDLARRPLTKDELAGFDAIVIDPPRSGAGEQARELATSGVANIAFVACDPVSFAKDARILTDGGYHMSQVSVIDQFRWSHHVETVTKFTRT